MPQDLIIDWIQVGLSLLTLGLIWGSVRIAKRHLEAQSLQLELQNRHFRLSHTSRYWHRFNDPHLTQLRIKIERRLAESDPEIFNNAEVWAEFMTFTNFFTELAIAHENELVVESESVKMWHTIVPEYWAKLQPFIRHERDRKRMIAKPFGRLANRIREITKVQREDGEATPVADPNTISEVS